MVSDSSWDVLKILKIAFISRAKTKAITITTTSTFVIS